MASGEYMRVIPDAMPLKVYGFKKVSSRQLEDIVNRLQRHTHSTETQVNMGELWNLGNITPRAPYISCKRAPASDSRNRPGTMKQPMKGKMLEKVIRRLQRPTISTMAAEGTITPSYELDFRSRSENSKFIRPNSTEEQQKLLERIQKPTTASRRKLYGHSQCLLCEDIHTSLVRNTMKLIQEPEGSTHCWKSMEEQNKVPRSRTTTPASAGGRPPCLKKAKPMTNGSPSRSGVSQDSNLPLISGLARSEKVADITDRLHPTAPAPTQSKPQSKTQSPLRKSNRVPPATQFVVFE